MFTSNHERFKWINVRKMNPMVLRCMVFGWTTLGWGVVLTCRVCNVLWILMLVGVVIHGGRCGNSGKSMVRWKSYTWTVIISAIYRYGLLGWNEPGDTFFYKYKLQVFFFSKTIVFQVNTTIIIMGWTFFLNRV